ncbi:MAG: hypothetical protein Alpg2KO_11590 [Alphaproteobacteria bacterium]
MDNRSPLTQRPQGSSWLLKRLPDAQRLYWSRGIWPEIVGLGVWWIFLVTFIPRIVTSSPILMLLFGIWAPLSIYGSLLISYSVRSEMTQRTWTGLKLSDVSGHRIALGFVLGSTGILWIVYVLLLPIALFLLPENGIPDFLILYGFAAVAAFATHFVTLASAFSVINHAHHFQLPAGLPGWIKSQLITGACWLPFVDGGEDWFTSLFSFLMLLVCLNWSKQIAVTIFTYHPKDHIITIVLATVTLVPIIYLQHGGMLFSGFFVLVMMSTITMFTSTTRHPMKFRLRRDA